MCSLTRTVAADIPISLSSHTPRTKPTNISPVVPRARPTSSTQRAALLVSQCSRPRLWRVSSIRSSRVREAPPSDVRPRMSSGPTPGRSSSSAPLTSALPSASRRWCPIAPGTRRSRVCVRSRRSHRGLATPFSPTGPLGSTKLDPFDPAVPAREHSSGMGSVSTFPRPDNRRRKKRKRRGRSPRAKPPRRRRNGRAGPSSEPSS